MGIDRRAHPALLILPAAVKWWRIDAAHGRGVSFNPSSVGQYTEHQGARWWSSPSRNTGAPASEVCADAPDLLCRAWRRNAPRRRRRRPLPAREHPGSRWTCDDGRAVARRDGCPGHSPVRRLRGPHPDRGSSPGTTSSCSLPSRARGRWSRSAAITASTSTRRGGRGASRLLSLFGEVAELGGRSSSRGPLGPRPHPDRSTTRRSSAVIIGRTARRVS